MRPQAAQRKAVTAVWLPRLLPWLSSSVAGRRRGRRTLPPQDEQRRASSGFSVWQDGQRRAVISPPRVARDISVRTWRGHAPPYGWTITNAGAGGQGGLCPGR